MESPEIKPQKRALKKFWGWVLVSSVALSLGVQSEGPDDIRSVPISDLRATQLEVGHRQIKLLVERFESLREKEELEEYLARPEKLVRTVIGPDGKYYVIDGHHKAVALQKIGKRKVDIRIMADFSKEGWSKEQFWKEMAQRRWAYLYDLHGRKIDPKEIPEDLTQLRDNPWRSIAWFVQKAGGYEEQPGATFQEFRWAKFFMETTGIQIFDDESFEEAYDQALELSQSLRAKDLPGYRRTLSFEYCALKALRKAYREKR